MTAIWQQEQQSLPWWVGNARLTELSGRLLGAHLAHGGLILFWAGAITILEYSRFTPDVPLYEQGLLLLPNLARLGWGIGAEGVVLDPYPYLVVGVLHLAASAVLGAGGLYHVFRGPAVLSEGSRQVASFHYDWDDPKKLSRILGAHLLFLGLGALLFVGKAMFWGGLYDPAIADIRLITAPTLNPQIIFGYLVGLNHGQWTALGMASVETLEDVVGGHIWVGGLAIAGGFWHLRTEPFPAIQKRLVWNGDAILSYSLGGIALAAFISAYFVAFNDTVYPPVFYGSDRTEFALVQVLLGTVFTGGHIWHAVRSRSILGGESQTQSQRLNQINVLGIVMAGLAFLLVVMTGFGLLTMEQGVF
ncbi:MAG: chlorophyll a/b binding light-harvesting protein [Kamptonema sp. SIO4C4]|nr:chlorophyll a/b binding light-harvesting protein [Kamptonema sp. SIO4C4]